MIFQQPNFLWGLFLLLVPVIVHLFDFRRVRKVYFSNVTFLQNLTSQKTPRKHLRKYLILVTRCLAILFLVMAFAQPTIPAAGKSMSFTNRLIYLDNDVRLQRPCAEFDCLSEAKGLVVDVAADRQVTFQCNDPYLRKTGTFSVDEWLLHLERVQPTVAAANMGRWLSEYPGQDLFVFSDFSPDRVDELERLAQKDSTRNIYLVPVSESGQSNVFIDSVYLDHPFAIDQNEQLLSVRLQSTGSEGKSNVLIRLKQQEQQLASLAVDLGVQRATTVTFNLNPTDTAGLSVAIEDQPITFDNQFYFSRPPTRKIKVGVVGPLQNPYLEAVLANDTYFDLLVFENENIDFQQLLTADFVIIHDYVRLPDWLDPERFDGQLLLVPPANIDKESYRRILGVNWRSSEDTTAQPLAARSLDHPMFQTLLEKRNKNAALPLVKRKYRLSGTHEQLLQMQDGSNYLVRLNNQPKCYAFLGPINPEAPAFAQHALFLPIMYRLVLHALNAPDRLFHRLGPDPVALNLQDIAGEGLFYLVRDNTRFVPEAYFNGNQLILSLPNEMRTPGHYALYQGETFIQNLAFNYLPKASLQRQLDRTSLEARFSEYPSVRVVAVDNAAGFQDAMAALTGGTALWKYALILSLVFLIIETLLLRWLK